MENTIQLELLELLKHLKDFKDRYFPEQNSIELNCSVYGNDFKVHRASDHDEALRIKRMLGIEDADKSVFDPDEPWHCLKGKISDKTECTIFVTGLPPMCRVETYEEEIPKTDVVTLAETIKVKRTRICCGGEK